MKQRAGLPSRLGPSLKALIQRFAFLLLVAAAVGLMVLGKADTVLVERARVGDRRATPS
jgi:rod shape-determining protein MreC